MITIIQVVRDECNKLHEEIELLRQSLREKEQIFAAEKAEIFDDCEKVSIFDF
jgi:hypothetical protein